MIRGGGAAIKHRSASTQFAIQAKDNIDPHPFSHIACHLIGNKWFVLSGCARQIDVRMNFVCGVCE